MLSVHRDDATGKVVVDWKDADALRAVTRVLLRHDFNILCTIPKARLCPTVTLRLNYIHWLEDLLAMRVPAVEHDKVVGVDIGTGASCIYPMLGYRLRLWRFIATEVDARSAAAARRNVTDNGMDAYIDVRRVAEGTFLADNIRDDDGAIDFCMCNPPFFESMEDACRNPSTADTGAAVEMVYPGGELAFVHGIVSDSFKLQGRVAWYTCMLGRKSSVRKILHEVTGLGATAIQTSEFFQGKTTRWAIAWSFLPVDNFDADALADRDPTDIFLTKKQRAERQRGHEFVAAGVPCAEAFRRAEEFLSGIGGESGAKCVWSAATAGGGTDWSDGAGAGGSGDPETGAGGSAEHEDIAGMSHDADEEVDSVRARIDGRAPVTAGAATAAHKAKVQRRKEEEAGRPAKRRGRISSIESDGDSFSAADAAKVRQFGFHISFSDVAADAATRATAAAGTNVVVSLLTSRGDERVAFQRFAEQLQGDVVRTSRKWRRLAARKGAGGGPTSDAGTAPATR